MKRWIALLLCVFILCNTVSFSAFASDTSVCIEHTALYESFEDFPLEDNDTLFRGYVDKQFYNGGIQLYGLDNAYEHLETEGTKRLYLYLKEQIEQIAANGGTTVFTIPRDICLLIAATNTDLSDYDAWETAVIDDLRAQLRHALTALLNDFPYELYWFDKTKGFSWNGDLAMSTDTMWFNSLTIKLFVCADYRAEAYNENIPSVTGEVSRVQIAVTNARAVVEEHIGQSDWDKLQAYKTYICDATDYNDEAVITHPPYGDPWQLIWVFDNDPETKVVCEGYSKAFAYLCELSPFSDEEFACYLVSGTLNGGSHMWNLVSLNGCTYFADVTNSDTGTVGQDGGFFMEKKADMYHPNGYTLAGEVQYLYDENMTALYKDSTLLLGDATTPDAVPQGNGANIRLRESYIPAGLRFCFTMEKTAFYARYINDLSAFDAANELRIQLGALLIPTKQLQAGETVPDLLKTPEGYERLLDIPVRYVWEETPRAITYTAVLNHIPESAYQTKIQAVPYMRYRFDETDAWNYVFGDSIERSYADVAQATYADYAELSAPTFEQQVILDELKTILNIA